MARPRKGDIQTDAEGNRLYPPGSLSRRKLLKLSAREKEIYQKALTPIEEKEYEQFRVLHGQSVQSLKDRQVLSQAAESAREEEEIKVLQDKARERKRKLDEDAIQRTLEMENMERRYNGLPLLAEPRSCFTNPSSATSENGSTPSVVSNQVFGYHGGPPLLLPPPSISYMPPIERAENTAKRRRVAPAEDRKAEAIERDRLKRAKGREAITAALPEVPEWVQKRLGAMIPSPPTPIAHPAHSSRIMQSKAEARAHQDQNGSMETTSSPIPSECNDLPPQMSPAPVPKDPHLERCHSQPPIYYDFAISTVLVDRPKVPASSSRASTPKVQQPATLGRPRSLPGKNPKENLYSIHIHEFVVGPGGPLGKRHLRVQRKLSSRMRLETFRRRVLNMPKGDPSPSPWSNFFIAFLKENKDGATRPWHFIHCNEDYISYLNYIVNESEEQMHHVVIGDRPHAELLPPVHSVAQITQLPDPPLILPSSNDTQCLEDGSEETPDFQQSPELYDKDSFLSQIPPTTAEHYLVLGRSQIDVSPAASEGMKETGSVQSQQSTPESSQASSLSEIFGLDGDRSDIDYTVGSSPNEHGAPDTNRGETYRENFDALLADDPRDEVPVPVQFCNPPFLASMYESSQAGPSTNNVSNSHDELPSERELETLFGVGDFYSFLASHAEIAELTPDDFSSFLV